MGHSTMHFLWSASVTGLVINLALAVVFLSLAYIGIRIASNTVRRFASYRYDSEAVIGLMVNLSRALMWFLVVLIALSILGFEQIASSLGTATGFAALGVAYALKDMLSDTVAGVYLVKDKDFEIGDRISADSVEGVIREIDLRKTRLELDNGDTRVINNSDVERKWTKISQ